MRNYLIFFLLVSGPIWADQIKPFTTDGCSVFPDGDMNNNSKWMACCIKHDFAYWKGGTEKEREEADFQLKECVKSLGESDIASVMHFGVRVGGEPFFPTSYRWGYGWPYARGYKAISRQESKQINARMLELRNLIDSFIKETQ